METLLKLPQYCGENRIAYKPGAQLSDYCTFQIGGQADGMVLPENEAQLTEILRILREGDTPWMTLGRGSNVLFSDEGYRGVVIHMGKAYGDIRLLEEDLVECAAGASLMDLCLFAWEKDLTGLEFAYGIPGSVGGAIYMNAGAYGGEMKDALVETRHVCPREGAGFLKGEAMGLGYRTSAYTGGDRVITGGVFRLKKGDRRHIRRQMDDYMDRRRQKQPLEFPSAGSTFKRPQGNYASALIDQCGLKGRQVGGAQVSEKHGGFVVNKGGATSRDVLELIRQVQREVLEQTGYRLECEVKIIG